MKKIILAESLYGPYWLTMYIFRGHRASGWIHTHHENNANDNREIYKSCIINHYFSKTHRKRQTSLQVRHMKKKYIWVLFASDCHTKHAQNYQNETRHWSYKIHPSKRSKPISNSGISKRSHDLILHIKKYPNEGISLS